MPRDGWDKPYSDPGDAAAADRLRRVRPAARPIRRPGDGQVFVYAGRRVGGVTLSDVDLLSIADAAGGLMVPAQEAGTLLAIRRARVELPVILDPARYLQPATGERTRQPSLWSADPLEAVAEGQAQHRVATFVSPSRYIAAGDLSTLQAVLDEGLRFAELVRRQPHQAPVLAALPIDSGWLRQQNCRGGSSRPSRDSASVSPSSPVVPAIPSRGGWPSPGWWSCSSGRRTGWPCCGRIWPGSGRWHSARWLRRSGCRRRCGTPWGRRSRLRSAGPVTPSAGRLPSQLGPWLAAGTGGSGRPAPRLRLPDLLWPVVAAVRPGGHRVGTRGRDPLRPGLAIGHRSSLGRAARQAASGVARALHRGDQQPRPSQSA